MKRGRLESEASTSNVSSKLTTRPKDLEQLNGSVWKFNKALDGDGVPHKLDILFFHGAQLVNDPEVFWKTWLSRDEAVVWPTAWLTQQFPKARILFISYDSSIKKSYGQKDVYLTIENLMHDIIQSSTCKAGQKCPVIFVGHCFGGIIIKQFLLRCCALIGMKSTGDIGVPNIKKFLKHCKGIFYYSTPNVGSGMTDGLTYMDNILCNVNESVVDFLKILSPDTARIGTDFSILRRNRKWKTQGIGETLETTLRNSKKTMVVQEASARYDLDDIYWADADHFNVSRANNNSNCTIFTALRDLIALYYDTPSSPMPLDSHKLPYPENTVGLEAKVSSILSQLRVTGGTIAPGVQAILLHGIGGIGKTTLGLAVCAKIPITGKFVAQVDVGENPTPISICNLQMDICERLSGKREKIQNDREGREKLRICLSQCKGPVLLFIDNVFEQEDLESLLPSKLTLPDRSRLIVTSRDRRISKVLDGDLACQNYAVQELEMSDSKKLFDQHVGECPPGKEQQAATIVNLCGGLPLALEVVGRRLKDREGKNNNRAWDSVEGGLRNCQSDPGRNKDRLDGILRWSYEQLDKASKQVFLDVSYLLRSVDWDWVECLGARSYSELECLKDFSLVKKVEGDKFFSHHSFTMFKGEEYADIIGERNQLVQVHDLLAALGTRISESEMFPKTRFLFTAPDTIEAFLKDDQQDYHIVEGLVFNSEHRYVPPLVPTRILDAMHQSLRILVLKDVKVDERHHKCQQIPGRLQICSTKLYRHSIWPESWRGVYPDAFPYADISRLNELRVLDIEGVCPNFADTQFPQKLEILQLTNVRELSVFHSNAFDKCTSLHKLSISRCFYLEALPPSFCRLGKLRTLILHDNSELRTLPGFDHLQSLEIVSIVPTEGYEIQCPSGIDKLFKLRHLCLRDAKNGPNDLDLSRLTLLEDIRLSSAGSLKELPKGTTLWRLKIESCDDLKNLPSDLGASINLQVLDFSDCRGLEALPDSIVSLQNLTKLCLMRCRRLAMLPNDFGNLVALQVLDISWCEELEALPDSIVYLQNLRMLTMIGCTRLVKLPNDFGNLVALEVLGLHLCSKLKALPDSIVLLQNLRLLGLLKCTELVKLPNDFGKLVALEELNLSECEQLEALPESIVFLQNLRLLRLQNCSRLETLPNGIKVSDRFIWPDGNVTCGSRNSGMLRDYDHV